MLAAALTARLREAGVTVSGHGTQTFARALGVCAPRDRDRLYWVARVALVRRQAEIARFDAVFDAAFRDAVLRMDPDARRRPLPMPRGEDDRLAPLPDQDATDAEGGGLPWVTLPAVVDTAEGAEQSDLMVPQPLPSALEAVADVPFDELDPERLALLESWLRAAWCSWPTRRTRRTAVRPAGHRVALRATMAAARRTGWEPVRLVRTAPVRRPRRVVLVCDVSGSMRQHTAAYLHLLRAAASERHAEVFAFATSLTRLTAVLAHRSPQVAMDKASAAVSDRFGGTRIAASLTALLGSRHGGLLRGAVVVVLSDGWDTGSADEMAAVMARLRRRAHRVIWVNPRVASPGFEPTTGAMAAALPFCDELLPGHSVQALAEVVAAIGRDR